jgi:ABC-type xylose transport system permease subunit
LAGRAEEDGQVLYAAAAVIGGASLIGGRGKAIHALLGGLLSAPVISGLGVTGVSIVGSQMATALVRLAAVTVAPLQRTPIGEWSRHPCLVGEQIGRSG